MSYSCDPGLEPTRLMGFSRHEYWSGLPFPLSGYLPDQDIELMSPAAPELAGGFFTTEPPEKPKFQYILGGKKFLQVFFFFFLADPIHFLNLRVQCLNHFF